MILVDSRGHGRSPWPGTVSAGAWVTDLAEVLGAAGRSPAHVVGVSMGGVQALHFALAHPTMVASLVLADTFAGLDPEVGQAKLAFTGGRARELGAAKFAAEYVAATLRPDVKPALAGRIEAAIADMEEDAYFGSARACFFSDARHRIGEIGAPALVVTGEQDDRTPLSMAKELAAGLAHAELDTIPDAGHLSNVDNPAAFNARVLQFLARVR